MKIEKNQLKGVIKNNLVKGPSQEYLAEVIFDVLLDNDDSYIEKFTQALLGILPPTKYSVGDEVYFKAGYAPNDYLWNKQKMFHDKLMTKDEIVKGTVMHVNPWSTRSTYKVAFETIRGQKRELEQHAFPESILMSEEFPEADPLPF